MLTFSTVFATEIKNGSSTEEIVALLQENGPGNTGLTFIWWIFLRVLLKRFSEKCMLTLHMNWMIWYPMKKYYRIWRPKKKGATEIVQLLNYHDQRLGLYEVLFDKGNRGVPWVYLGCTLGVPWVYLGCTLGVPWVYLGCTLGVPWVYLGCTLGVPWVCVRLFRHSNRGLITKGTIGSPVGKRSPFAKRVQNIWEVLRKC